ncbi:MAG: transporter substrate-binding domain-containing protein [Kordiimonadaceae bacterium]|nr:transporter substrate-binding domain-containing protein [Kordiimonadaceae bacterium]
MLQRLYGVGRYIPILLWVLALGLAGNASAASAPILPLVVEGKSDAAPLERPITELIKAWSPIKFGYVNFFPVSYTKAGVPSGEFIDLMNRVVADTGLSFEAYEMPAGRLYRALELGEMHMFFSPKNGSGPRAGSVLLGEKHITEVHVYLYRLAGVKAVAFKDLRDTAVITLVRFKYGGRITDLRKLPGVKILTTTSHATAVLMLKAGRAPYVLDYRRPFEAEAEKAGIVGYEKTLVYGYPAVVMLSKKVPHAGKLLKLLESSIERIQMRDKGN